MPDAKGGRCRIGNSGLYHGRLEAAVQLVQLGLALLQQLVQAPLVGVQRLDLQAQVGFWSCMRPSHHPQP